MPPVRRLVWVTAAALVVAGIVIGIVFWSGRRERVVRGEIPGTPPVTPSSTADSLTEPPMRWDSAAGGALLLARDSTPDTVSVVRPEYLEGVYSESSQNSHADVRNIANVRFDLFGRSGIFGSATVAAPVPSRERAGMNECLDWPAVAVTGGKTGWNVALQAGVASAIPLDSIEAMSATDSALFTAQVVRLATLTNTRPGMYDPVFANIPFVVEHAYRFRTAVIEGIIASTRRSIPSEATPREEHLFVIAERPVGSSEDYRIAFSTRVAGAEGDAPVMNVLALVTLLRDDRPTLVASDEYEDGGAVALIERVAPGEWTMVWRSAYTGC